MLKKQISLLLIVALLVASLGAFAENGQPEPARSPGKKTCPYLYCYREGQEAEGEINQGAGRIPRLGGLRVRDRRHVGDGRRLDDLVKKRRQA